MHHIPRGFLRFDPLIDHRGTVGQKAAARLPSGQNVCILRLGDAIWHSGPPSAPARLCEQMRKS
jgi:hypothetical protein